MKKLNVIRSISTKLLPNRAARIFASDSHCQYTLESFPFQRCQFSWFDQPRTVCLVIKDQPDMDAKLIKLCSFLESKNLNIIVEDKVRQKFKRFFPNLYVVDDNITEYTRVTDFIITLGGDGTLIKASALFPKEAPPILSFSLGSLGFLLPFKFDEYKEIIERLLHGKVSVLIRMRLALTNDSETNLGVKALNDMTLSRGNQRTLTTTRIYVDNEHLTNAIADGIIVSTPTGSTAYSLSAGGSILDPTLDSILITPICPRSLSFRPIIFSSSCTIKLEVAPNSRSIGHFAIDGRDCFKLLKGQSVLIKKSRWPLPTVQSGTWVNDIQKTLKWNINFS